MITRQPRMCFDKTLQRWYVKWGGKRRWLSTDRDEAEVLYAEEIAAWAKWQADRAVERAERLRLRPNRVSRIADLYAHFINAREQDGAAPLTLRFYNASLRRFLRLWGDVSPDLFGTQQLHVFREHLLGCGLNPKTIAHELNCIRTLFTWGADLEFCGPKNLRGCRNPAVPPRQKPKGWTPAQLRRIIKKLPERVKPWAVTQYACAARPSEIIRLVHEQGEWVERGVFRLEVSKSEWRSKQPRHLVLSAWALSWLKKCEPDFSTLSSYRNAFGVRRVRDRETGTQRSVCVVPGGPHPLRHTAASHLLRSGVDRADVDLVLGHLPTRVSLTYAPPEWQALRRLAARLRANLKGVA